MSREHLNFAVVAAALSPDPRVAPTLARKAGFAGLQFDARSNAIDIPELSGTGRREFARLLSSQDQQLVGLRLDLSGKGLGPGADIDHALSRIQRVLEAAKGLAAPLVCVDVGPLPEPAIEAPPKPKITDKMAGLILLPSATDFEPAPAPTSPPPDPAFVSQVDAALFEIGRLADRTSVIVALRSELSSCAALERALRTADCPWFGIDLDPAAVLTDAWDLDTVFSRLGPHIRHVRGRDAVRGQGHRTKPAVFGRGDANIAQLFANLAQADYRGWITLDPIDLPDRTSAALAGLAHLQSIR